MASLFKNLLGNSNDRELSEEMRAVLAEMRKEGDRYERLIEAARGSAEQIEEIAEPLSKAVDEVSSVTERITEIESRLEAMSKLAGVYQELESRAQFLTDEQKTAETQLSATAEDSERIRTAMEEIGGKLDQAIGMKEQLSQFLQVDNPFQQLRTEAETIRTSVDGTADHMNRLREQHERLLDAHRTAVSKMEALDRRRDEFGRSLTDKERRVVQVEASVRGLDGVQQTLDEVRRDIGALKSLADLVGQKTSALESQRETLDRALSQAENLDRAMRQVDAGVRQQQDNERLLSTLQEQMNGVRALHEVVVERSNEISQLQREIDERTQAGRHELAAVTDETKKTIERFDFERRGMEAVTQRVADLRATVSDVENRFKPLVQSSQIVAELNARTQSLTTQLQTVSSDAYAIDAEISKLSAMRRELEETGRKSYEIGQQVARIEQSRPAIEAGLTDLSQLAGAHALVRDALEQARLAQAEINRIHDAQSETRSWLSVVEQSVGDLRGRVDQLSSMAPSIEFVQGQTTRINDAMASIETRRSFVEDVQRRMGDLEAMNLRLEERSQHLQSRAEAAEQKFATLASQAAAAEKMMVTIATVSSGLDQAEKNADAVHQSVSSIAARVESVEGLANKTRALKSELDQRHEALAEAQTELEGASVLRQEVAESAQQLEALTQKLSATLSAAEQKVSKVESIAHKLEDRSSALQSVAHRMGEFEERLARWDVVDQNVAQSLEQIIARQVTVEALKSDLDRMFEMAEKTATHVREITTAHRQVEESRTLLDEVSARIDEVMATETTLDERKRQMSKAEERLARAEGLLTDVRSSLEAIQGQKAIIDQAVEKAGSLPFLLKQAEAAIQTLRDERKTTDYVRSAVATLRDEDIDEDYDEDVEAKAA